MRYVLLSLTLIAIVATSLATRSIAEPAGAVPAAPASPATQPTTQPFDVYPADVNLTTARDEQSIVVRVVDANGISRDITKQAKFTLENPALANVENAIVKPLADGVTTLKIEHAGKTVSVPVNVKDAKADRAISFKLDVEPVFLKAGCNTGGCHGQARGKDGFELSLFGYNPDADYHRLTREQPGRRINLAVIEDSLMLQKTTGLVAHTGGKRFEPNSEMYNTIFRWLDAGAPQDPPDVAKVTSIEINPKQIVLEGDPAKNDNATHQLTVRAHYSDGTDRDVTRWAVFSTNNDSSAKVTDAGLITSGQRGEAFVMAKFSTFTVGSQVIVIPKGLKYEWPKVPENNFIDAFVNAKLRKLRIIPSGVCSDEVFLRRAFIDIVGQLPKRAEYDKFMADTDPKKREKLVEELLSRKEFVELWVMKWAEVLQIRSNNDQMSYKATVLYYNWLQDKIARNVPFDQIVQELLSSDGGTFTNPAANYYQVERDPLKLAENTAQIFMGMRIQCSQCHNHPFDRWTQNDYYGFVAFFTQVSRKRGEDPRETIVTAGGGGEVPHPVTKQPVPPTFLGSTIQPDVKGKDRREVLAKWLASPDNPYFSKNLANIVWAHFLGKGIIDPVDDVRISNPATNPELLDELGKRFTGYKYDFKQLVRDICTSRTYQLATQTNETNVSDDRNFSHAAIRRLRAEVALDCASEVTESHEKFRALPVGARAVQIADGATSNYFLTTFGRATRDTVCSCEVKMEPNLSQAFHLLNGKTTNEKIASGGVVKKLFDQKMTGDQVIEELYIRCYARKPTEPELAGLKEKLPSDAKEQPKALEDLFWALLNSQEFIFNH